MSNQENNQPTLQVDTTQSLNFDKTKSYSDEEMMLIFNSNGESNMGKIDSIFVNKNRYKNKNKENKENEENEENKETPRNTKVKIKDIVID
jgi:hypothetical protein